MGSVFTAILYAIVVLIAILLIGLVLIQPSKSSGFGSAFGGLGEGVFGAQTLSHLSKLTIVLMSIFFALTLVLAVISGHKSKSLVEGSAAISEAPAAEASTSSQPAASAPAAAAQPAQSAPAPAPAKP